MHYLSAAWTQRVGGGLTAAGRDCWERDRTPVSALRWGGVTGSIACKSFQEYQNKIALFVINTFLQEDHKKLGMLNDHIYYD